MNGDCATGVVRAFVHLAYGFGAQQWLERQQRGEVPGLNEHLPYGYFWAHEKGFEVRYSEDADETAPARLIRMVVRGYSVSILFMRGAIATPSSTPTSSGRTQNHNTLQCCSCC